LFTTPYFYTGLVFGGDPAFVTCAETQNITVDCEDMKICIKSGTTSIDVVRELIPEDYIVEVFPSSNDDYLRSLNTPTCNVIASDQPNVAKTNVKRLELKGPYEVGTKIFSKEPLAMVTRVDDPEWNDFVNWVLQALIVADREDITQERAHEMPTTNVFGEQFKNMYVNAIKAVGNYREIYERSMETTISRQGLNLINDKTSGLMYSHPFGNLLDDVSPGREEGGIIDAIFERGYLNCGVLNQSTSGRIGAGKSKTSGMVVDYCYALSAGIFKNDLENTKNERTKILSVSLTEAPTLLENREVDVIGLVEVNIVNDVTGKMSFSQPIYFSDQKGPLALATYQHDTQWASFVYWTVSAIIYAEEENISQDTSRKMPLSNVFGSYHKTMLRDIISAVGNYGDIYNRNIDTLGPRIGRNMLNTGDDPQLYAFPGIID